MAQRSSNLEKLWAELKRRKVFRVLTAYTATSYIIIEVINNLISPLHLPEWIASGVVLLLLAGLPLIILLSWIYDFTPEGFTKTGSVEDSLNNKTLKSPAKKLYGASNLVIAFLLIVVVILVYPKINKENRLKNLASHDGRFSVAVIPFQNMTNDTTWNIWQEGIQNELITFLTNYEELKVIQPESLSEFIKSKGLTDYASFSPSVASSISKKLDTDLYISGSIKLADNTVRINAQLIDTKSNALFKSFQINGTPEKILNIIDTLSSKIKNFIILTNLKKESSPFEKNYFSTNSPEAYKYYYYGGKAFNERDFQTAVNLYSQAVKIDSNFLDAFLNLSVAYYNLSTDDLAKAWCLKAFRKRDQMSILQKTLTDKIYATNFGTPIEVITCSKQILKIDDQRPSLYYSIGYNYINMNQFDKAIPELEKALEIYDKWDSKPKWVYNYTDLGYAYHKIGRAHKERKLYKLAEKNFPDDPELIYRQAILALAQKKTNKAEKHINNYKSILEKDLTPEADIATNMAYLFYEADNFDKSEEYLRLATELEPEEPDRLNGLAWLLIDKNRDLSAGLRLVDKALELSPDNFLYLDTKGWGLYKQSKFKEALDLLQKSWYLRRQKAIYDHEAFLHLEAAKKAYTNQKNNKP